MNHRRLNHRLIASLVAGCAACLDPLEASISPDAGPQPPDVLVPLPAPDVIAFRVRGHDGRSWPLDQTPRRPILELEVSRPLDADEDPPVYLFEELPYAPLVEDLRRAPLLVAHARREVPTDLRTSHSTLTLAPRAPLTPAARYVVALAGWARATDDGAPFPPFVASFVVASAGAGAVPTASWPPDGAAGVPPELELAAVRFDDDLGAGGVVLEGPDGRVTTRGERVACDTIGWTSGACWVLRWEGPLQPHARYALVVSDDARDRTGAPLEPWRASFDTGAPATGSFQLLPLPCEIDERPEGALCVLSDDHSVRVRGAADRPVRAFLAGDRGSDRVVAPRGELILELRELPAEHDFTAELRLVGLDGSTRVDTISLATTEPLATLTISEVCADPHGPEPRQEWVELLNFGVVPVSLAGTALADRADQHGDVISSALALPPGARALLVADGFDPRHPDDPDVPDGTPLIRVGASLASGGLSNAGEPLFLRDAHGRRLASVPALPSEGAGLCARRAGGPRDRDGFSHGDCTPGAP